MEEEKNPQEGKQSLPSDEGKDSLAPNPNYHFVTERKKSNRTLYIVILGVIVLTVVGAFIFNKKLIKGETVESSPSPSPTPTQTPKPALNRADWSFEVLNGTGVTGAAKKIADKLKELGYQVIKTGNADKSDYEKTEILVKDDLKEKIDLVIADLKDVIKIASVAGELKDSTASARIILGKD